MGGKGLKQQYTSWSGDVRFTPARAAIPHHEKELADIVKRSLASGDTVRAAGAKHSCSPIVETDAILIDTGRFTGFHHVDVPQGRVTVGAGLTLEEIGEHLFTVGLALENMGHINKQTIAGAMATGTHGAGKHFQNISGQMIGARLVNGNGEVGEYTVAEHPEIMQALKVSLGSLGIINQLTLRVLPAFQLQRMQYCTSTSACLENLDWLMEKNRNFAFYWYPRRDDVSIRLWNIPGEGTPELSFASLYKSSVGWSKDELPSEQELKFNELEYSVELDVAVPCFQQIRKRIIEKHRKNVAWRVLFRPVAGDDVFLSNCYGGDRVAITIHQNHLLPYQAYFDDIEPIFREFGGRPHWGKKHSLTARSLKRLYPRWDTYHRIRKEFDPRGVFMNDYLKRIFLEE